VSASASPTGPVALWGSDTILGQSTARSLAEDGTPLVLIGPPGAEVAEALAGTGTPTVVAGDPGQVVDEALRVFGQLDSLVVCTPTGARRDLAGTTPGDVRGELDDLLTVIDLTRSVWTHFRARGEGRVVFVVGTGTLLGPALAAPAAAAAAGMVGLLNVLTLEGASRGLRVNLVAVPDGLLADPAAGGGADGSAGPVAAVRALAGPKVEVAGTMVAVEGRAMRRLVVGVTPGVFAPALDVAWVRGHLGAVLDMDGVIMPDEAGGEMPFLTRHLS